MSSVNKVLLIGNVGRDPEVRTTTKGVKVVNFSMATQRRVKQKDDKWESLTDWHNITAYAKSAEICENYVFKGKQIYIEGSLRTDSWEKDGKKHSKTVVVANNIQLLGKKESDKKEAPAPAKTDYSDEDIPF
jgi:single-strand DNA-binding protein